MAILFPPLKNYFFCITIMNNCYNGIYQNMNYHISFLVTKLKVKNALIDKDIYI